MKTAALLHGLGSCKTLVPFLAVLVAAELPAATDPVDYQQQILSVGDSEVQVRVPTGHVLELLTDQLDGPRLMTFADNGDLFIGSRSGNVYRLEPPYTKPEILVHLTKYPHSVAFRPREILIAQTDGVYRAPYSHGQARIKEEDIMRLAPLPGGGGHNSRTVKVGPDEKVYVSLGISGNCSDQYLDPSYPFAHRRGGVLVLVDGDRDVMLAPFASGLRNPVGFDWHPVTNVLYASNNGPDHLGFDQPPEYFSRVDPGSFHGMPWFQYDGRRIQRDDCITGPPPLELKRVVPPAVTFPGRNAPMDVAFVPPGAMDPRFVGDAVVALRGSWGTRPHGSFLGDPATRRHPKVVVVRFEGGTPRRVDDLITGFQLPNGRRWARPVGVALGPEGSLYISSDSGLNGLFRLKRAPQ